MILVALVVIIAGVVAGVIIYRKAQGQVQRRNIAPKPTIGRSNPLFCMGESSLPAKDGLPGPPEPITTSQSPRPRMTPKRAPPPPPAMMSAPPLPVPVYAQQVPDLHRPDPPTKPLPKLKPKQAKPTFTPPMPPVQPGTRGVKPGVTQGVGGPKVPLKPPVQRR